MSRYDIQGVKERNPIEEVISRHGIVLLRSGSRMTGRCPFHDDKTPSLVVYPETRSFYCFGCGAAGDVIDFIRRLDGLGFRAALERLNDGAPVNDEHSNGIRAPVERHPPPARLSLDDRMILTAASAVYHDLLWQSPRALAYLEGRGIGPAAIRRCRVGYSDGHAFSRYLQRHRLSVRRAREMGLLWKDGRERMAGRVVVPELRGDQCIWMVGRPLNDQTEPKYRGLSLPKPILGYDRVRGRTRVFLTEGTLDYVTGVGWNLPICSVQGAAMRAERLTFLDRARKVLLLFDNDDEGRAAASSLSSFLGPRAITVEMPPGVKDLNALAQMQDGRETFFQLVREAEQEASHALSAS